MKTKTEIIPGKLYHLKQALGWAYLNTTCFNETLTNLGEDIYDMSISPGVYLVTYYEQKTPDSPYSTIKLLIGKKEMTFSLLEK
jgi:hypothetical protein